jgi:hypothetical protein
MNLPPKTKKTYQTKNSGRPSTLSGDSASSGVSSRVGTPGSSRLVGKTLVEYIFYIGLIGFAIFTTIQVLDVIHWLTGACD